jgi:hypothetical protein
MRIKAKSIIEKSLYNYKLQYFSINKPNASKNLW